VAKKAEMVQTVTRCFRVFCALEERVKRAWLKMI